MTISTHNIRNLSVAALFVADALFFTTTNASSVTSVALIVGFGLAIMTLYLVVSQILVLSSLYGLPFKSRHRKIAVIVSGIIAVVLALITIGEFTMKDVFVIIPMIVVGAIYISYGRGRRVSAS